MTEYRIVPELLASRPDVAVTISRERDEYFRWDGDGPDPELEGFEPYDVTVTVSAIRNGRLFQGIDTLGGSYFERDEPFEDIHGYFPQMLAGALADLALEMAHV